MLHLPRGGKAVKPSPRQVGWVCARVVGISAYRRPMLRLTNRREQHHTRGCLLAEARTTMIGHRLIGDDYYSFGA